MFVDGDWRPSEEGRTDQVLNPSTGEVVAEVQSGTKTDVDQAVSAARRAFENGWSETTPAERARMLLTLAERLESDGEELARLESLNVGKPWGVSTGDVEFSADNLRLFAGAARLLDGKAAGEYTRGLHQHDPAGTGWRRSLDRSLELPAPDDRVEDRAGPRRRQHRRPEALRADPHDRAACGGACRGHLPARGTERHHG